MANSNSFVVIFAVIPRYKSIYEAMANLVTGSSVEILEKDSENIVQIIRSRYKGITSTVQVLKFTLLESILPNFAFLIFRFLLLNLSAKKAKYLTFDCQAK